MSRPSHGIPSIYFRTYTKHTVVDYSNVEYNNNYQSNEKSENKFKKLTKQIQLFGTALLFIIHCITKGTINA